MPAISATIITHNESANIARAIRSLSCADEIVVIDSDSTDGTREIAAGLGARVITHTFEGFAAQKNLSSDASSERLDSESRCGRRVRPQGAGRGSGMEALGSLLPPAISLPGGPNTWGDGFCTRGGILTTSFASSTAAAAAGRAHTYTNRWWSTVRLRRCRGRFFTTRAILWRSIASGLSSTRIWPQRRCSSGARSVGLLRRTLGPPWVFVNSYLFRLGMLDGRPGYFIAKMAARYVQRKYAKLEEMRKSRNQTHDFTPSPQNRPH